MHKFKNYVKAYVRRSLKLNYLLTTSFISYSVNGCGYASELMLEHSELQKSSTQNVSKSTTSLEVEDDQTTKDLQYIVEKMEMIARLDAMTKFHELYKEKYYDFATHNDVFSIKANPNNQDMSSIITYVQCVESILEDKALFDPEQTISPTLRERIRLFKDFIHCKRVVSELRVDIACVHSRFKEEWNEGWNIFLEKVVFNLIELVLLPEIPQRSQRIFLKFFKDNQSYTIQTQEHTLLREPYFSLIQNSSTPLPDDLMEALGILPSKDQHQDDINPIDVSETLKASQSVTTQETRDFLRHIESVSHQDQLNYEDIQRLIEISRATNLDLVNQITAHIMIGDMLEESEQREKYVQISTPEIMREVHHEFTKVYGFEGVEFVRKAPACFKSIIKRLDQISSVSEPLLRAKAYLGLAKTKEGETRGINHYKTALEWLNRLGKTVHPKMRAEICIGLANAGDEHSVEHYEKALCYLQNVSSDKAAKLCTQAHIGLSKVRQGDGIDHLSVALEWLNHQGLKESKRMAKYLLPRVTPPVPCRLHPWLHRGQ